MPTLVAGSNLLRRHFLLVVSLAVYLLLVLPLVPQHGTSYDEQVDLRIAESYTTSETGWLRGSDLDSINVRLPMYVTALLVKAFDGSPIYLSRYLSCLIGALALIAVYVFCTEHLNRNKGVVACMLLAVSPYFLAFSKVAMTEGDIFITCFTAWLLLCVASLRRSATLGWTVLTGVCLGLALGSKISAVALIAAVAVGIFLPPDRDPAQDRRLPVHTPVFQMLMLPVAAGAILSGWIYARPDSLLTLPGAYAARSDRLLIAHYALVFSSWVVILVTGFVKRSRVVDRWPQLILVCGVAVVTFFALPPVHTTNPVIISSIFEQFLDSNAAFSWAFSLEALTFHFLVTLIKPSPIVGIGLWLSLFVAVSQWNRRPELRIPIVVFLCYFVFITMKMTWIQTYYMMPLVPILTILLADQLVALFSRQKTLAFVAGGIGASVLTLDLARSYPDLHLNGYQWVGERYLAGRSTVGYRSIVQTPSDGVEQVLRWAMENVPRGERLLYYTHARHLVFRIFDKPVFLAKDGSRENVKIDEANYVLTAINSDINHGWGTDNPQGSIYKYPYDEEKLRRDFRKVYSIRRRFGIEVAAVWYRKKPYRIDFNANIVGFQSEAEGIARHPVTY